MGRSGTPTPSSIIQTLFFFLFFCFYFFSKADWKVSFFLPVHLNCVLSGSACCPVWWHLRGSWLCSGLGRAKTGKLLPTLMLQQAEGVKNCKREGEAAVTLSLGQAAVMSWSLSSNLPPGLVPSQATLGAVSLHHSPLLQWVRQAGPGKCCQCCGMSIKNCCWQTHSTTQSRPNSVIQLL